VWQEQTYAKPSNYPQKLLFITQEMDLGENLLQNPKSQGMEMMERKRERE
jgi:hypothetical protein